MEAPNFRGTYPLDGKVIGPAWQAAWDVLGPSERYKSGAEVAAQAADMSGAKVNTVASLLWKAVKARRLEQRYRVVDGRRRVFYRRHKAYR